MYVDFATTKKQKDSTLKGYEKFMTNHKERTETSGRVWMGTDLLAERLIPDRCVCVCVCV